MMTIVVVSVMTIDDYAGVYDGDDDDGGYVYGYCEGVRYGNDGDTGCDCYGGYARMVMVTAVMMDMVSVRVMVAW